MAFISYKEYRSVFSPANYYGDLEHFSGRFKWIFWQRKPKNSSLREAQKFLNVDLPSKNGKKPVGGGGMQAN